MVFLWINLMFAKKKYTMKKKLFLFTITGFLSFNVFSQEMKSKFSINPIQLSLSNAINFEYERSFNNGKLGVAFTFANNGATAGKMSETRMSLSEQSVTFKSYSNSFYESGWWYGGAMSVASGFIQDEDDFNNVAYNIGTLGVSGKVGHQIVIKSFYANVFGGIGYAITNDLFGEAVYNGDYSESNLLIPYGLNLGITF